MNLQKFEEFRTRSEIVSRLQFSIDAHIHGQYEKNNKEILLYPKIFKNSRKCRAYEASRAHSVGKQPSTRLIHWSL